MRTGFKIDPPPHFEQLLPRSESNPHTLFKLNKILDDFYHYTLGLYQQVTLVLQNDDLQWFFNVRTDVNELKDIVAQLDTTLLRLLRGVTSNTILYAKFEETSILLLDLEKYSLILRENCDMAIKYNDLNNNVLESVKAEFGGCLQLFDLLRDATGLKEDTSYSWEIVTKGLKLGVSPPIVHLPTFNKVDEEIYNDFVALESRLLPLSISMDIIPGKLDEFLKLSKNFPRYNFEIVTKFDTLNKDYHRLKLDLAQLKLGWLKLKWADIIRFLCEQVAAKSKNIMQEFYVDEYRLIGQVLDFIYTRTIGMGEEYNEIIDVYNDTLLGIWNNITIKYKQPIIERKRLVKKFIESEVQEIIVESPVPQFNALGFLDNLSRTPPQQETQIPLICDRYIQLGLPVIQMMAHHHSRIPRGRENFQGSDYSRSNGKESDYSASQGKDGKHFSADLSWDSSVMDGSIDCEIRSPETSPAQEYYSKFDHIAELDGRRDLFNF